MSAAAVAAGAVAVESANTVGVITTGVTAGTYYMVGVPFESVGSDSGTITFDDLIKLNGISAYEDGDSDCPEILVSTATGYGHYYYITDAWDATDQPLGYDAWAPDGYECTAADIQALGDGFWFIAPVAASGASITTKGQVTTNVVKTVSFAGGGYSIIANPFPTDVCLADVVTTGVTALEDGDSDCAEILVSTASGYSHYYYITDAWDATDQPLGYDAWAPDGYECLPTDVIDAGASFWIKSNDSGNGSITFSL